MAVGSLLLKILSGEEETTKLLISDTTEVNGVHLLKWSIIQMSKRYSTINIITTNGLSQQWTRGLPCDITQRLNVRCLDIFDSSFSLSQDAFIFSQPSNGSSVLMIDNLSLLLLQYKCAQVCQLIHTLSSQYRVVISLIHNDIHDDTTISSLSHIMSSIITLSSDNSNGVATVAMSSIKHKRKSGMIITKEELYEFTVEYKLQLLKQLNTNIESDMSGSSFDHPGANLTFDLSLTKQEKESRSQVVLPYTKRITNSSSSSIVYEADENDDLDDSDPDDDLNI